MEKDDIKKLLVFCNNGTYSGDVVRFLSDVAISSMSKDDVRSFLKDVTKNGTFLTSGNMQLMSSLLEQKNIDCFFEILKTFMTKSKKNYFKLVNFYEIGDVIRPFIAGNVVKDESGVGIFVDGEVMSLNQLQAVKDLLINDFCQAHKYPVKLSTTEVDVRWVVHCCIEGMSCSKEDVEKNKFLDLGLEMVSLLLNRLESKSLGMTERADCINTLSINAMDYYEKKNLSRKEVEDCLTLFQCRFYDRNEEILYARQPIKMQSWMRLLREKESEENKLSWFHFYKNKIKGNTKQESFFEQDIKEMDKLKVEKLGLTALKAWLEKQNLIDSCKAGTNKRTISL